jgi:hypothetical protein
MGLLFVAIFEKIGDWVLERRLVPGTRAAPVTVHFLNKPLTLKGAGACFLMCLRRAGRNNQDEQPDTIRE